MSEVYIIGEHVTLDNIGGSGGRDSSEAKDFVMGKRRTLADSTGYIESFERKDLDKKRLLLHKKTIKIMEAKSANTKEFAQATYRLNARKLSPKIV